ncbi:MAG: MaoC family dehydratase [Neptuniibacter sp.]
MSKTLIELQDQIGGELGVSKWFRLDQMKIDEFASCTEDHQWIHVDVEKAEKFSPFGTTIAHGFLTLSLLAPAHDEIDVYPSDAKQIVNYGLDKVRFMGPVPSGSRVRFRVNLVSIDEKSPGKFLFKTSNVLELEGHDDPVLLAESLAMIMI